MAKGKIRSANSSGGEERKVYQEFGPADPMARGIPDRPPNQQTVRVQVSRKGRGGKTVTVITGFEHQPDSLTALAKQLKAQCGTGGTAKDNVIEIQGDHAQKLVELLVAKGYKAKRSGG
ncbi:translation initiation factor [Nodosilinea sp. LEGE 07088]|uniref:translation initiation factor n=1 Tax=Nodosilinea sp. LEGE 07088 TaxID=2777968 RepID=UPI00188140F2|nr:translation initiation factor [Nodosilinea sp. LEGE 07088]MBE9139282.1 translation initiation factor [Nodosilinea sp. LEGE 07088]